LKRRKNINLKKIILFIVLYSFTTTIFYKIINPVFKSNEIIISWGFRVFNICTENPNLWNIIKKVYIFFLLISNFIYSKYIINFFSTKKNYNKKSKYQKEFNVNKKIKNKVLIKEKKNQLNLKVGCDYKTGEEIIISESGLYQNFLITGTIGSGKTSSAMYPFTEQLIKYNFNNPKNKIGMLILDVKGNYYKQIKEYAKKYGLLDDIIVIELGTNITYNPLDKPNLKASVLANRLKTILNLFSENNSESYWIDKAEQVLTEAIKLCRLYNGGYVDFIEIHKIVTDIDYYKEKIKDLRNYFMESKFSIKEIYELNTALEFFKGEYEKLDQRTLSILKSEITRITNTFISDYDVINTFCPSKDKLSFNGFEDVIQNGKILVLNMNISEYRNLSKIIAAYLKLDFQTTVMGNLARNRQKTTAFICDEYAEYVTKTDSDFFSLSREAKCINIVSTQSYSSIKNTLKDETAVKVICQNLINKIWFRTDDIFTIEEAQKQIGKEEKVKTSKNISENAKETRYSYISKKLSSKDSSISESLNFQTQNEYVYETNFFTQDLEVFSAIAFLSDGSKILKPRKIKMLPYFLDNN